MPVIRTATQGDYDTLGALMFTAIRSGPSPYSDAQRRAWIATPKSGADWHTRLAAQNVVLALVNDTPAGFMTLCPDGYIDLAYILPTQRGCGVFRALYAAIVTHAKAQNLTRMWTHASMMAQPAFAAMGFYVVKHEVVTRAGETLARAEMEKRL